MTVSKYLLGLLLLCSFAAESVLAKCVQSHPDKILAMMQESSMALNKLFELEQKKTVEGISRNLAILSIILAAEGRLNAQKLQSLTRHVQEQPNDLFAKMYEGYAWVFSAEGYSRRKNYLRAAEYVKRGFFLIDEAVDAAPDSWRLRYLRLRMDAFVTADLGRYVIALKDAAILSEMTEQLPVDMLPMIAVLRAVALDRSGKAQEAQAEFNAMRKQFAKSPVATFVNECGLQDFFIMDEVTHILTPSLGLAL